LNNIRQIFSLLCFTVISRPFLFFHLLLILWRFLMGFNVGHGDVVDSKSSNSVFYIFFAVVMHFTYSESLISKSALFCTVYFGVHTCPLVITWRNQVQIYIYFFIPTNTFMFYCKYNLFIYFSSCSIIDGFFQLNNISKLSLRIKTKIPCW